MIIIDEFCFFFCVWARSYERLPSKAQFSKPRGASFYSFVRFPLQDSFRRVIGLFISSIKTARADCPSPYSRGYSRLEWRRYHLSYPPLFTYQSHDKHCVCTWNTVYSNTSALKKRNKQKKRDGLNAFLSSLRTNVANVGNHLATVAMLIRLFEGKFYFLKFFLSDTFSIRFVFLWSGLSRKGTVTKWIRNPVVYSLTRKYLPNRRFSWQFSDAESAYQPTPFPFMSQ